MKRALDNSLLGAGLVILHGLDLDVPELLDNLLALAALDDQPLFRPDRIQQQHFLVAQDEGVSQLQ